MSRYSSVPGRNRYDPNGESSDVNLTPYADQIPEGLPEDWNDTPHDPVLEELLSNQDALRVTVDPPESGEPTLPTYDETVKHDAPEVKEERKRFFAKEKKGKKNDEEDEDDDDVLSQGGSTSSSSQWVGDFFRRTVSGSKDLVASLKPVHKQPERKIYTPPTKLPIDGNESEVKVQMSNRYFSNSCDIANTLAKILHRVGNRVQDIREEEYVPTAIDELLKDKDVYGSLDQHCMGDSKLVLSLTLSSIAYAYRDGSLTPSGSCDKHPSDASHRFKIVLVPKGRSGWSERPLFEALFPFEYSSTCRKCNSSWNPDKTEGPVLCDIYASRTMQSVERLSAVTSELTKNALSLLTKDSDQLPYLCKPGTGESVVLAPTSDMDWPADHQWSPKGKGKEQK